MQSLAKLIQQKFDLVLSSDAFKELELRLGSRPIKKKGRILRSFLYENGIKVGLNKCYDIFASMEGAHSFSKYEGNNRDKSSKIEVTFGDDRQKMIETIIDHAKNSQKSLPLLPQNLTNKILEWMVDPDENEDISEEQASLVVLVVTLINSEMNNSAQFKIPIEKIYSQKEAYLIACSMERLARNKLIKFNEPQNYSELFNKNRNLKVKILNPDAFQKFE